MVKVLCLFFFYWYSKRLSCYQPALAPKGTESIRSCAWALKCCKYFFCLRGSHFAAQVSYHTCASQCLAKPSPISSVLNELCGPAHLSSTVEQFRYSEQFTSWEARAISLLLEKRAGCPQTFPKAPFSPVPAGGYYCLQFQYITKVLKSLEGKERDPKLSQIVIPLSSNPAGIPKELENKQVKLGYSKSYSNLERSWQLTPQPRGLFKCPSKLGSNLGS